MDLFDLDDSDSDLDLMPDEYSGFLHWDLENSDSDSFDEGYEPEVLPRCCLCQFKFELLDSIVVCM